MVQEYKFFSKVKTTGTMLYIKIPNDLKEILKKGDFLDVTIKPRKIKKK